MFEASRSLTHAALAVLILIWGTTWAVIRVGLRGLPPFTGVALRFGFPDAPRPRHSRARLVEQS